MSEAKDQQPRSGPPPRRPGDDLVFFATAGAIMSVFLVFNVLNVYHEHARGGRPLHFWEPMVWEGSSGVIFLALIPVMQMLTRRVWPLGRPRLPKLAFHLAAATAVSLVHVLAAGAIRWSAYRALNGSYNAFAPLGDWPYELRKDLLVYAALVGFYVGWLLVRSRPLISETTSPGVLEVRDGARRHFVPLSDVVWVEAAGNYVELHRDGAGLLHRASLSEMERRLGSAGFVRIHRSRLVRRDSVAAVESKSTGDFVVRLRDGRELAGSRRYRHPLLAD